MIAESQIREQLGHYLRGDISLDVFEDWLVQRSWNMHKDSDEAAQKLASQIELRLAEHSSGHLDEAALREEFRSFVTKFTVEIVFGGAPLSPEPQAQNRIAVAPPQVIAFRHPAALSFQGGFAHADKSPAGELG